MILGTYIPGGRGGCLLFNCNDYVRLACVELLCVGLLFSLLLLLLLSLPITLMITCSYSLYFYCVSASFPLALGGGILCLLCQVFSSFIIPLISATFHAVLGMTLAIAHGVPCLLPPPVTLAVVVTALFA